MSASKPSSDTPAAGQPAATTPKPAPQGQADQLDDDGEPWRHPPVAPKDESPLDSLGRSVTEAVTGSIDDKPAKPKP